MFHTKGKMKLKKQFCSEKRYSYVWLSWRVGGSCSPGPIWGSLIGGLLLIRPPGPGSSGVAWSSAYRVRSRGNRLTTWT